MLGRPNTRCLILAVAALALAAGLAACGGSDDSDKLIVYSGRNEELVGPLIERFQDQTGIEVEVRYGDTAELAATLREEGERSPADVFFSQDAGALGALQKEGLLLPLPQSTLAKVQARYRSEEGRWVGASGRARVLAYDGRKLTAAQLPDSYRGLTGPAWRGQVGWAPTNASFQAFVTAVRTLEGEDQAAAWLSAMKANGARAYENNIVIRDAIASGELKAGLINHYYVLEAIAEEGPDYPVKLHFFPRGDLGSLVNVAGAGVLRSSDKPAPARRFVAFLLSPASQRYFANEVKEYPLAGGVSLDPALPPLASIKQPKLDLSDLDDLQGTLALLQKQGVQ